MSRILRVLGVLCVLCVSSGCETPSLLAKAPPTVVFLSDFGTKDDSVALCKGVMWEIAPNLRIVDLTHEVEPYDVRAAGRLIAGAAPYYPAGTVFLAVVDPGVGSERKAIAVRSRKGKYYVGPDNGLFSRVLAEEGVAEARVIGNKQFQRAGSPSYTFHGRDIFAPASAYLADHAPYEQIGDVLPKLVAGEAAPLPRFEAGALTGAVDFIEEPYGNVISDIPASLVEAAGLAPRDSLTVTIGEGAAARPYTMPYGRTFSDVKPGEMVALLSSRGQLSFSLNQGSFAREFGSKPGQKLRITKTR